MRTISLGQVRKGERFILDGVAFVKLDEDREASFALAEDVVLKGTAFDTKDREDRNNYYGSHLHYALDEWAFQHEALYEAALERPIDLFSMDGMDDYGRPELAVRILTLDEYRKYRIIIPKVSENYWLATPDVTFFKPMGDGHGVCFVRPSGRVSYEFVSELFSGRPSFYLNSSVPVSVEDAPKISFEVPPTVQANLKSYSTAQLLAEVGRRMEK